jgi:surface protein
MLKLHHALKSSRAAIDLASIMVGIIVLGLIGSVIAATVFAVIPWSQDKAAKQQLESIHTAENAFFGLSSDANVSLKNGDGTAGSFKSTFTDSAVLDANSLLTRNTSGSYCVIATTDGKDYHAYSKSGSGKWFVASNSNKSPQTLNDGVIPCVTSGANAGLVDSSVDDGSGDIPTVPGSAIPETPATVNPETQYNVNKNQTAVFIMNCPTTTSLNATPLGGFTGTLTINDVSDGKTYSNQSTVYFTSKANTEYVLKMTGTYTAFTSSGTKSCLQKVATWGNTTKVTSTSSAFRDVQTQFTVPDYLPANFTNLDSMFIGSTSFNDSNVTKWDTSNVTSMTNMFNTARSFNQNIGSWNVANVTNMSWMFAGAISFNQDISAWQTVKVTDMYDMFIRASAFNQNIGRWDTSKVTRMDSMFSNATVFSQDLSSWNVNSLPTHPSFSDGSRLTAAQLPKFKT